VFVRETSARLADGSTARYLQLVESRWDPERQRSIPKVVYNFGRREEVDEAAVRRLVDSLSKYLPEHRAAVAAVEARKIIDSRPLGTAWLIEGLWHQLGLDDFFLAAIRRRHLVPRYERALLGMILNRAIDPRSKRGTFGWLSGKEVCYPAAAGLDLQDFYRALDLLLPLKDRLERRLARSTCDLFGLTVDLVFYDTTSTYFEIDEPDALRRRGKSKDHRGDLPQIVVGVAVNRDAIPLRHWVHPGNTADISTVKKAIEDLDSLNLGRIVFVGDRAMGGRKNLAELAERKIPYLIGVKLRKSARIRQVLSRAGRYREVLDSLDVKEVKVGEERYVVCRNEEAARRDRAVREKILAQIASDLESGTTAKKALAHPVKRRYLRKNGRRIEVDFEKARSEEKLDGKSVILVGDPTLTAEEAALGYRGRYRVETAIRHMKSFVDLRPINHRTDGRIRAHVFVCVLTYLLQRLAEIKTGKSWSDIRDTLQGVAAVTIEEEGATATQVEEPSPEALAILRAMGIPSPPTMLSMVAGPAPPTGESPPEPAEGHA
jgi:transposase